MESVYGLIGFKLSHSFSKKYFTEKFERESIKNSRYELFELDNINMFPDLIKSQPNLKGLNVTIPYKQEVIPYLDGLDETAESVGAVNVIKFIDGKLIGFNSDYHGFKNSLEEFISSSHNLKALILGTGGAAKAVKAVLTTLSIPFSFVTRNAPGNSEKYEYLTYSELTKETIESHRLIINTTPVGMHPNHFACPKIPYTFLTDKHYLYDLVYNPETTEFMQKANDVGGKSINGLKMLHIQAEVGWDIWNK